MDWQFQRILKDVASGAHGYAKRHKKVVGGVGGMGVAAGFGRLDESLELGRKGIGLGRRLARLGDADSDDNSVPQHYAE